MAEQNKHLKVEKESRVNEKRAGRRPRFIKRPDLRGHGQRLSDNLGQVTESIKSQLSSQEGEYVIKLEYDGALSFDALVAHGIEFISQEGNSVCVGFTTEEGLAKFGDHLNRLGKNDQDITRKQLLEALESVDSWNEEDRKSWAIKNIGLPDNDHFSLDVELWPVSFSMAPKRKSFLSKFEKWLEGNGIKKTDSLNLDSLVMYRVLVSHEQARLLLNHTDVRLVDLPPKSGLSYNDLDVNLETIPTNIPSPQPEAAKICILDSGINTNHPLLAPAIAESNSFVEEDDDISDKAGHGTQVAGVALYGDVAQCKDSDYWVPENWIYNGRILDEKCEFDEETIENKLIEAVEYFVELGCRVFNLSIGNKNAPYDGRHVRGMAYVLDDLSRKHDILFVVSVGNFNGTNDEPLIPKDSWRDEYPDYLLGDHNFIIDPASAINALTVGGLAVHDATDIAQKYPDEIYHLAAANRNQPSPFTRHGPTVRGALKPELVAPGGNIACPVRYEDKQWQAVSKGVGVLTLNHNFLGNTLLSEVSGTSFAAPYITHLAGKLLNNYPDISARMLRALLISQASVTSECLLTFDEETLREYPKNNGRRHPYNEVSGYGAISEDNLFSSSEDSVLLMAEDEINNDCCQFYELPLPETFLRRKHSYRELRVALSYSPAVRTTRLDYRATKITFNLVKGKSLEEVQKRFNRDFQKEQKTLGDSVTAKSNRVITSEARDRGTAQASIWKFRKLSPDFKWFVVVTRHDAYGWGEELSLEKEGYSLVVTVSDKEYEDAQLYTQINQIIREKAQARYRVQS